jgi:hypothetical protein
MKPLKESIPNLFEETEIERVDYYIEKIRDSYKATNRLYIYYQVLQYTSIIAFYLYFYNKLNEISLLGIKITDSQIIEKWFLLVPSLFFLLSTYTGYLRVYQKEGIEWLLAKYRSKEYETKIHKLTFPSNHILGMELLHNQQSKFIRAVLYLPNTLIALISILGPIILIYFGYTKLASKYQADVHLIISSILSALMIITGKLIIQFSQRI